MIDIVLALFGPRWCGWCGREETRLYRWFYGDIVPAWVAKRLSGYDRVIGKIGHTIHWRLHKTKTEREENYDPCEGHS